MSSSYTLHDDLSTLHFRFAGHLNLSDILDMIDRAATDPAHRDGTNVIADFLAVTRFDIDRSTQRQMFSHLDALSTWEGLPRSCAILARGEPLWTLAGKLVEQTTLKSPVVFDRFQSPTAALGFVGLDPQGNAKRFGYHYHP